MLTAVTGIGVVTSLSTATLPAGYRTLLGRTGSTRRRRCCGLTMLLSGGGSIVTLGGLVRSIGANDRIEVSNGCPVGVDVFFGVLNRLFC